MRLALLVWALAGSIGLELVSRGRRTDVWPVYAAAARQLRALAPLYDLHHVDGFQYFPQMALAALPFDRLGPAGGLLWRACGFVLFAVAMWRVSGMGWPVARGRLFLLTTAFAIPPAMASLLNGQANLHVTALLLLAAVDVHERRRNRATVWLALGLCLKPIVVIMALLVCIVDTAMIGRLLAASALLVALPLLAAPFSYLMAQYRDCLHKLALSSEPDRHFEDLRGLLWRLGWEPSFSLLRALAAIALAAAAATVGHVRSRLHSREVALALFTISAGYLMLFNSRTQSNSYVLIAPAGALVAAVCIVRRRWRTALATALLIACWCGSSAAWATSWLRPLSVLLFAGLLSAIVRVKIGDSPRRTL